VTWCRWASVYRHVYVVPLKHRLRGPRSMQPRNAWRRRQYFRSKRREKFTQQHSVRFQKAWVLNLESTSCLFPTFIYALCQRLVAYIAGIVYSSPTETISIKIGSVLNQLGKFSCIVGAPQTRNLTARLNKVRGKCSVTECEEGGALREWRQDFHSQHLKRRVELQFLSLPPKS